MKAKVKMIKDQHRFKQSSCGVQFFASEKWYLKNAHVATAQPQFLASFLRSSLTLVANWEGAWENGWTVFSFEEYFHTEARGIHSILFWNSDCWDLLSSLNTRTFRYRGAMWVHSAGYSWLCRGAGRKWWPRIPGQDRIYWSGTWITGQYMEIFSSWHCEVVGNCEG